MADKYHLAGSQVSPSDAPTVVSSRPSRMTMGKIVVAGLASVAAAGVMYHVFSRQATTSGAGRRYVLLISRHGQLNFSTGSPVLSSEGEALARSLPDAYSRAGYEPSVVYWMNGTEYTRDTAKYVLSKPGVVDVPVDLADCVTLLKELMDDACDSEGRLVAGATVATTGMQPHACEMMVPRMVEALFPMLRSWPYRSDVDVVLGLVGDAAEARGLTVNRTADLAEVPMEAGPKGSPVRVLWSPWLYENYFRVMFDDGRWCLTAHPYAT